MRNIPKLIHYVWLGDNKLNYLAIQCLKSWEKYFPDHEIILWNEQNIPKDTDYIKNAFKLKKWSNVSNYVRMNALYNYGGLYFDTDFEAIRNFDFLDDLNVFLGYENEDPAVNSAVMGSIKGHPFMEKCINYLIKNYDGSEASHLSGPGIATIILKELGLVKYGMQYVQDIRLFPIKYFYPYPWDKPFTYSAITEETYGIHLWAQSWLVDDLTEQVQSLEISNHNFKLTDLSIRFHFFRFFDLILKKVRLK